MVLPASAPLVLTAVGTERADDDPLPSLPQTSSAPHVVTVPSEASATLYLIPAAIAITVLPWSALTPLAEFTTTGTALEVVELFPSWPSLLLPQLYKTPFESRARLWESPEAIATIVFP